MMVSCGVLKRRESKSLFIQGCRSDARYMDRVADRQSKSEEPRAGVPIGNMHDGSGS